MKKPKTVVQLFCNISVLGPEHRDAERRRDLSAWHTTVSSSSGSLEDGLLRLGEDARQRRGALEAADLVVLIDCNDEPSRRLRRTLSTFQSDDLTLLQLPEGGESRGLDIFQIRRTEAGLELHLHDTAHERWIGRPRRGDFKVGDLRAGRPVRITLNGKSDFTLTGRRARQYKIVDYIAIRLGSADRFEIRGWERQKRVPTDVESHVDLRKVLF